MNEIKVTDYTILIDSREKAPYHFDGIEVDGKPDLQLVVKRRTELLETGDYSIEGMQDEITVERKSVEDAYLTFGMGRERFERELERMANFPHAAVVIEGGWREILLRPPQRSKLNPKSVYRSCIAWSQRYGVHFWAVDGRRLAEVTTFRILDRWWKDSLCWRHSCGRCC